VTFVRLLWSLGLAAFIGLLAYGLAAQGSDTTIDDGLVRGETTPAPPLRLEVLSGGGGPAWDRAAADGTVDVEELRGTPLAINFWASWCKPCDTEAAVLRDGWKAARDRGVLLVGVNQQDRRSEARRFMARHAITFPHVRDPGRDTADEWGVSGLPETFFVTARGGVAAHVVGAISRAQFDAGVDAAIAGRPQPPRVGGAQGARQ
jgi:cytochrome c biogenesis protein CcmG/thiol:disulfide interchange protein DsbE